MKVIRCPRCKLGRMMASVDKDVIETVCINCGHRIESQLKVDLYPEYVLPRKYAKEVLNER